MKTVSSKTEFTFRTRQKAKQKLRIKFSKGSESWVLLSSLTGQPYKETGTIQFLIYINL
jgi:hypothetical protein